jgi:type IV pilus assembly protein PilC
MAVYTYKVRDLNGRILSGVIEADDEQKVVEHLRSRDYFITDITPQRVRNYSFNLPKFYPKVKAKDMAMFCRQLATLMDAGVPILACLKILQEQTENLRLKDTLKMVISNLESGNSLANSIRPFPEVFPEILISMVETGEMSGALDEVMVRLANHFEREHDIREKAKSAMTYPIAIMVVSVFAITFMLVFMLPKILGMLPDTGEPLPLPTRMVLGISDAIRHFWWMIIIALAGIYGVIRKTLGQKTVQEIMDTFVLRVPIFGKLINYMIVSRFARSLGTMLKSGVGILEALGTVQRTLGNKMMAQEIELAKESILQGRGISDPLEGSKFIPPIAVQMIAIGEESGSLDTLLEKVAVFYDREVDNMLARLSTMVEPVMIVGIGLILGFIIIAMMLPMFTVMTTVPM